VLLYSNPPWSSSRWLHLRADALSHDRPRIEQAPLLPQRVSRRLGPAVIARIIDEYREGASTPRLAARYRIGKGTLLRLIRESGVTVRGRGSSTDY
jgi:hypothetical protein